MSGWRAGRLHVAGGRPCPAVTAPAHFLGPPRLNGETEAGPSLGSGCEVLSSGPDYVYCPLPHKGALTGCFRTSVLNSFTPDLPAAVPECACLQLSSRVLPNVVFVNSLSLTRAGMSEVGESCPSLSPGRAKPLRSPTAAASPAPRPRWLRTESSDRQGSAAALLATLPRGDSGWCRRPLTLPTLPSGDRRGGAAARRPHTEAGRRAGAERSAARARRTVYRPGMPLDAPWSSVQ